MLPAPVPLNEPARRRTLDALRVLDSLPETFSNAVAASAAGIAGTPISAVTLVDADRLWFKGSCGLGSTDAPRDIGFCAHTILGASPLVVPDMRADVRFHDNPLVTGPPHVRFYAGFPIVVDGHSVGAVCVIDDRPRTLEAAQIERLTRLAAGTAAWMQARLVKD